MNDNWTLVYYPGAPNARDPGTPDTRARSGEFLLACDAECKCGYVQHPPQGGECPVCGRSGELLYEDDQIVRRYET